MFTNVVTVSVPCVFMQCACVQDFLKSEVSAENILFWQACEKFKKIPSTSAVQVQTLFRLFVSLMNTLILWNTELLQDEV